MSSKTRAGRPSSPAPGARCRSAERAVATGSPPAAQDSAMLAVRVTDVDEALALCLRHGARVAAEATDRPAWGPTLRTAHLRDPDGHLIELQSS
ncbi:VOC family protein [Kitasatospora sp. NPDC059973]|uniref:VOC family protein n=1 Tax=Kitasatospora sp. NPDC059973 TaxID=3347020 RepID=UPI0036AB25D3